MIADKQINQAINPSQSLGRKMFLCNINADKYYICIFFIAVIILTKVHFNIMIIN